MRQFAVALFVVVAFLGTAPVWGTDYSEPLTPQQEDFKARFMAQDVACRKQAMDQFSLSVDRVAAFCVCEIDVIARNSSLKELAIFTAAATGTRSWTHNA